jgi:hypothetical protein
MVLSTREKALIGVLLALLVALGLYFGVKGVTGRLAALRSRVDVQEALLARAVAMDGEVLRMQQPRKARRAPRNRSLIGYVEQLADRVNVRDRIQLNLIARDSRSGLEGLDIKVEQLSLDEFTQLLYTLEDAEYRLIIDQLDVSPSFRDKNLLRLSMRVLARE